MLTGVSQEDREKWSDEYEKHSKTLQKNKEFLWRGKYACKLSKIGVFGSNVVFSINSLSMVVDNMELTVKPQIVKTANSKSMVKTPTLTCKYQGCQYSTTTIQERAKHHIKIHGEMSREQLRERKKQEKTNQIIWRHLLDDVFKTMDIGKFKTNGSGDSGEYKVKYEMLLEAFNVLAKRQNPEQTTKTQ